MQMTRFAMQMLVSIMSGREQSLFILMLQYAALCSVVIDTFMLTCKTLIQAAKLHRHSPDVSSSHGLQQCELTWMHGKLGVKRSACTWSHFLKIQAAQQYQ